MLVKLGVTVIVAVIGALVVLVAVKMGGLPVPAAANPMLGLLFVHVFTVPTTLLMKSVKLVL